MSEASPAIGAPPETPPPYWRPARRNPIFVVAAVLLASAALLAVLAVWGLPPFARGSESTNNAYVKGRVTVIAPQVSGYVSSVLVKSYERVRKGQILVTIDDGIYRARVDQAGANVEAAEAALANSTQAKAVQTAGVSVQVAGLGGAQAQLLKARADMARAQELVQDGSIARREYDQTLAALRAAEAQVREVSATGQVAREGVKTVEVGRAGLQAQVDAARALLRLAEIDLEHSVIRAPEDGQLGEIAVHLGQFVAPGTQFFALVPSDIWIVADYKEAQTHRIRAGQKAWFTVDALGGATLTGYVAQLAPATGSQFAVLKPDNATGNFVKVPQRIGVLILVDRGQALAERLRPGMSVETRVEAGR
ncbi:HlyD family secretion protein [Sphingomonas sp. M1-B02]|uniref:HlyD family secretion protein n=1 Tax=Sphingomonas sp. M1-B02 TaxID=3114300 RepID=UPI00223F2BE6|nr:HlyD family secretion protein [Sphingomonas sp. S6-11]UZK66311.1 HlyD family secretion protein [Sphingomonas sp. S6-11]